MHTILLDASVVVSGEFTRMIESDAFDEAEIIIPRVVVDELQARASQKEEQGLVGLEEIKRIGEIAKSRRLRVTFDGKSPSADDPPPAERARTIALINDLARQRAAIIYTSERVQALAAEAEGIPTRFIGRRSASTEPEFARFFDPSTMSVHLKEGMPPKAKRGRPGRFELVDLEGPELTRESLHRISMQILEASKSGSSGLEVSRPGALVVQYEDYRIAITQPPFSDSYEITIVHPIVRLGLNDYNISEKLMSRLSEKAEGILISGPPGSGKSTLASGLANFYHDKGKIVKTFESPRDLQVDPGITQYTKLDGSFENSADILLLVRPDYTIFDEVRRREDFEIFADLRLTGVGMVGVVHANDPLGAIQRFIGKIELGMIPNVLDTVVFVKAGEVEKVHGLELKVKVPSGMTEQDLARPVIEVRDFEDGRLEYEIYTFGEENVIIPVPEGSAKSGVERLAEERLLETFRRFDPGVEVEVLSANGVRVKVEEAMIPRIIGRGGSSINELEKELKVKIDVVAREFEARRGGNESLDFAFSESRSMILLTVDKRYAGMRADLLVGDRYVTTSKITRKGQIKIPRYSTHARHLAETASAQEEIKVILKNHRE